jgi:hypothetical protein
MESGSSPLYMSICTRKYLTKKMASENKKKYRASTIGQTLGQTLLDSIDCDLLKRKEAAFILELFDQAISRNSRASNTKSPSTVVAANLSYFSHLNGIYHLRLNDVRFLNQQVSLASYPSIYIIAEECEENKRKSHRIN